MLSNTYKMTNESSLEYNFKLSIYLHARPLYSVRQSRMLSPMIPLPAYKSERLTITHINTQNLNVYTR